MESNTITVIKIKATWYVRAWRCLLVNFFLLLLPFDILTFHPFRKLRPCHAH